MIISDSLVDIYIVRYNHTSVILLIRYYDYIFDKRGMYPGFFKKIYLVDHDISLIQNSLSWFLA